MEMDKIMSDLDISHNDGIATLTMNRPEARNALSMEMRAQLTDALHEIENDDAVRCVILTGAGEHFMAGGDVKGMADGLDKPAEQIRKEYLLRIHELHPIMFALRRRNRPGWCRYDSRRG